jgi:hypothetical protein
VRSIIIRNCLCNQKTTAVFTKLKRLKWVLTTTQYFVSYERFPPYTVSKPLIIQILEKLPHITQNIP